jgi:hypothetical protein
MKLLIFILCLIIVYICLYLLLFYDFNSKPNSNNRNYKSNENSTITTNTNTNTNHKCDVKSCGALDPVSDPKYNMQQIVKQSILLEEHLTNKNKRCRDCITKHFQHIIGLAEEAQMLATTKCNKYPLLIESVNIYNNLFNEWFNNRSNETKILEISEKLRIHRKKLIAIYFFDDNYDIKNFSTSSEG